MQFYELDKKQLYKELNVTDNGLSEAEAKTRLETFGPNMIKGKKKRSLFVRFIDNFIHAKNQLISDAVAE